MRVLPFITKDASSAALAFHERPIDLVHLARTTLGDPSLEGEMLEAFGSKASMLMLRMAAGGPLEHLCSGAGAQGLGTGHRCLAHRFGS